MSGNQSPGKVAISIAATSYGVEGPGTSAVRQNVADGSSSSGGGSVTSGNQYQFQVQPLLAEERVGGHALQNTDPKLWAAARGWDGASEAAKWTGRVARVGIDQWRSKSGSGPPRIAGVWCMGGSSLAYSLMGLFVKFLTVRGVPALEAVMVRCLVIAAISGAQLARMGHPLLGSPRVRHLVAARALLGFVALSAFFASIEMLPLRNATALIFTAPVMTALLAAGLLGERWGPGQMAGTVCSFAGVLLVAQPDLLFAGASGPGP